MSDPRCWGRMTFFLYLPCLKHGFGSDLSIRSLYNAGLRQQHLALVLPTRSTLGFARQLYKMLTLHLDRLDNCPPMGSARYADTSGDVVWPCVLRHPDSLISHRYARLFCFFQTCDAAPQSRLCASVPLCGASLLEHCRIRTTFVKA